MATAFSIDRFLAAPELVRVQEVERGLPAAALRDVTADGAVSITDLVGIVGTRRTLDRRLAGDEPLTLQESDRLARFAEVLALATHIYGSHAAAMEWLRAPQFHFEGTPPIKLLSTHSGSSLVVNLLQRARHGMLA